MADPYLSSYLFECNLGRVILAGDERGIRAILLGVSDDTDPVRRTLSETLGVQVVDSSTPLLVRASHQIASYLAGERELFSFDVSLDGTPFQRRVWDALCRIPYGETRSYQDIADAIGQPKSVRAVANACGQNHLPLVIPCHRVIASDGSLGGFSAGLDLKRRLLNMESGSSPPTPLFAVQETHIPAPVEDRKRDELLSSLPDSLADWLRLHLGDKESNPAVQAMTPEAWLAAVLEEVDAARLAILAEWIATFAVARSHRIIRQIAEEMVAASLTLALTESPSFDELGPLLRAAALMDSPFYEVTCRRLLNRSSTPASIIEDISAIFRSILDGSLQVSKRLRDRTVDLWVLIEERQPSSVWAAESSDDPSAIYASHGLFREALIMAENSLALGHHDPETLLIRISDLHEKLGELPEAYNATLRLVAISPGPNANRRLRELADRLEHTDSRLGEE